MKMIIRHSRRQVSCVRKSLICLISFITNDLEVVLSILDIKRMCLRHTCTKVEHVKSVISLRGKK